MNTRQQTAFNETLKGVSFTIQSQIANGIDQVLAGTWECEGFKKCKAWQAISNAQRTHLSGLLDKWLYEASGGKGCISDQGLRSYYKPDHKDSTPIMPAKMLMV